VRARSRDSQRVRSSGSARGSRREISTEGFTDTVHLNDLYWNLIHCPGTQPEFHLGFKVKRSPVAAKWDLGESEVQGFSLQS
jgi:hypothetical protein